MKDSKSYPKAIKHFPSLLTFLVVRLERSHSLGVTQVSDQWVKVGPWDRGEYFPFSPSSSSPNQPPWHSDFLLFFRIRYINVWNIGSVLTERLFCLSRTPVWKLSKHIFMGTWSKSGPVFISNSSQHQSASVQLAHPPAFRACHFP